MDATAEIGRSPVSKSRFSLSMEMRRLTRDGTFEPFSRDQIIRREQGRDRKILIFLVQLTTRRNGNLTRSMHTLF